MWQQWINLILGLWIIVVPFLGITASAFTWTLVVTGAVVAGLALWGAVREQDPEYHQQTLRTMGR